MTSPTTTPTSGIRHTGWGRYAPLWLLAVPGAWFAYVLAFNPTDRIMDPTGPCLFHAAFGIDGPTCGITRMTWYLLHADLINAARVHLAALLLVPVLGYAWTWWIADRVFGRRLPTIRITKRAALAYAVFFIVYAVVLRNLPWEPFTWFYVPDFMA